jgi:hypothetical protein
MRRAIAAYLQCSIVEASTKHTKDAAPRERPLVAPSLDVRLSASCGLISTRQVVPSPMGWYLHWRRPHERGVEFFDLTAARPHAITWNADGKKIPGGKVNEGRVDRFARRPGIDVLGSANDQCGTGRADKFPDMLRVFQENAQCGPFAAKKTKFQGSIVSDVSIFYRISMG